MDPLFHGWTQPVLERLQDSRRQTGSKSINDPVWGNIRLQPWEVILVDSPFFQRLRGTHQLGLAYLVYPSAVHSRFEHSLGALEASERMMAILETPTHPFPGDEPAPRNAISPHDRACVRLAALFHDLGHPCLSHASEPILEHLYPGEFEALQEVIQGASHEGKLLFPKASRPSPSESLAILALLSPEFYEVFRHLPTHPMRTGEIPLAVSARILGSSGFLDAAYLRGLISGPLDADKLDYMARDSFHAGYPIGLDVERIISLLRVIRVDATNAPDEAWREKVSREPRDELGLEHSASSAYDQMMVARAFLFDRLYFHHKVRAAETMWKSLARVLENHPEDQEVMRRVLFSDHPDATVLSILSGDVCLPGGSSLSQPVVEVSQQLKERNLYVRAFAFASRFLPPVDDLAVDLQEETQRQLWDPISRQLQDEAGQEQLAQDVLFAARELQGLLGPALDLPPIQDHQILVDFPPTQVVPKGGKLLTVSGSGKLRSLDRFFQPKAWIDAYEQKKRCGFLFTPAIFVPLVALASRLAFYRRFRRIFGSAAELASKPTDRIPKEWIERAREAGLLDSIFADALLHGELPRILFRPEDLDYGLSARGDSSALSIQFAEALNQGFPRGFDGARFLQLRRALGRWFSLSLDPRNPDSDRPPERIEGILLIREGQAAPQGESLVFRTQVRDQSSPSLVGRRGEGDRPHELVLGLPRDPEARGTP